MRNAEIADVFSNIGDLLELKGEMVFKVRAYQRAARAIENYPEELESLAHDEAKFREIPGIGKEIAQKIQELVSTGKLEFYERLKEEMPPGVTTLMSVPGIGPKTAYRIAKELGTQSIEELQEALNDGRLESLARMGKKTVDNLRKNLESFRSKDNRTPLGVALPEVERLMAALQQEPAVHDLTVAGSVRRGRETVGDVDLLCTSREPDRAMDALVNLPWVARVLAHGRTKSSVLLTSGLQVDFRVLERARFGTLLQYFTGSMGHNVLLRERARRMGLSLSDLAVTRLDDGTEETYESEEEVYRRLGLAWIPPELREERGEIEAAEKGALPKLIQLSDLKGDLHIHTDWSDGNTPLEQMVARAAELGYEYLCITDHSVGRAVARGLSVERLQEQRKLIEEVRKKHPDLVILHGSEVDIRADGSMDYPDEVLAWLDYSIGSIHSAMQQDRERMTARIVKAIHNPYVTVIGHLTTRLLGERDPIDADVEAVFQAAREAGTALEINASPSRLDLKDSHVFRARELGVPLIINTDAHAPHNLAYMRFGVGTARRGWCTAEDILNTRSWAGFKRFLAAKREKATAGAWV